MAERMTVSWQGTSIQPQPLHRSVCFIDGTTSPSSGDKGELLSKWASTVPLFQAANVFRLRLVNSFIFLDWFCSTESRMSLQDRKSHELCLWGKSDSRYSIFYTSILNTNIGSRVKKWCKNSLSDKIIRTLTLHPHIPKLYMTNCLQQGSHLYYESLESFYYYYSTVLCCP